MCGIGTKRGAAAAALVSIVALSVVGMANATPKRSVISSAAVAHRSSSFCQGMEATFKSDVVSAEKAQAIGDAIGAGGWRNAAAQVATDALNSGCFSG